MYVASDSPGLRALLEALPPLRRHVVGCPAGGCGAPPPLSPGTWRFPSQREAAELAADLWLLAAAEHTSGFKTASSLPDDTAPSASLDCLKARAAPTHPGAPPEQL